VRGRAWGAALGLAVLALTAQPDAAAEERPGTPPPSPQVDRPLRTIRGAEARIVDDLDRTVLLRGVNVNGLGDYYQEHPDLPSTLPLTEADFAAMAAHGFDVVRLLMSWSALEPEPGRIDDAALARVEEAVGWAEAHDLYVLLDMHQDAWGKHVGTPDGVVCPPPLEPAVGWDGAPAWATSGVGTIATCRLDSRELSPAAQASFTAFYLDLGGVQSHLVTTWAAVAARFAPQPVLAGYDLLNEPNPGLVPGVDDYTLLAGFYDRAIRAIRAAETGVEGGRPHLAFFEPSVVTGPLALPAPLPGFSADEHLVYAPHLYNESISLLPGTIEEGFANARTAALGFGTTFFSGEWGWFGDPAADQGRIERYAAAEDAHLVGGTWWQWVQACGDPHAIPDRGVRPPCAGTSPYSDGLVVRSPDNVAVLERAYPRAAPGRLETIASDHRTGTLAITGTATRTDTAADLWVPARCTTPTVTGVGLGAVTTRGVDGGWRIEVPVVAPGTYRIEVGCHDASPPATTTTSGPARPPRVLPATGTEVGTRLLTGTLLVLLAAAGGRALRRTSA
jgi:endoglycosylceramidase